MRRILSSRFLPFALLVLPLACKSVLPVQPEALDLWEDAGAGVEDPRLAELSEAFWQWHLARDPIAATYLGDE